MMRLVTPGLLLEFAHWAGIVIALGAVTVVDSLGVISRTSKRWTQVTVDAHHVTRALIWTGIGIIAVTWAAMLWMKGMSTLAALKTGLLVVMVLNGSFLSFYISPRLDELKGTDRLVPKQLQPKIALSAAVSFVSWWSFVYLTVVMT